MAIGTGILKKKTFVDPLGLKKSKPDLSKTAEEIALERRQRTLLDQEISKSEKRFKSLARSRGGNSLLSAAPSTAEQPANGARGARTLLGAKKNNRASGRV